MLALSRTVWCAVVGALTAGLAGAATWATADGLAVDLDDATGAVTKVVLGGRAWPLAPGGGLTIQPYTRNPTTPDKLLLDLGAEQADGSWSAASFADWTFAGDTVRRRTGGAASGDAYLEIGDGRTPGVGLAATALLPVEPGSTCRIQWAARTPTVGLTYILCVRLFDAAGRDLSATATPPAGWTWSPQSLAHYRADPTNTKANTWETLSYPYQVPDGVAAIRLSLRVYRGGELRADLDDLRVTSRPSGWGPVTALTGPVRATAEGLEQHCEQPELGLACVVRYRAAAGRLAAEVEARPLGPPRPRCFRLAWRLPLDLTGWTWAPDPRRSEPIVAGRRYEDSVGLGGHPLSRYPVVSVSAVQAGLALAAPLDPPVAQTFVAEAAGLATTADLALANPPVKAPARFAFSLFRHDPAWTFRAALERYYQLFGELTATYGPSGVWTLRLPRPEVARPADFGLTIYECGAIKPETQRYCREQGVRTFFYIEPWGRRQVHAEAKTRADLPPYEQRLAQLREWAAAPEDTPLWQNAPRRETAQALLNSLLRGPDGEAAHFVDLYHTWATWWQLNTDPDLPAPNTGRLCLAKEVEPALAWADGIYLDSVTMAHAGLEDHDPTHLAAADLPLTFSLDTGTPVVLSGQAHYEFIRGLRDDLHGRGKALMANLFAPATRLFGHLVDVYGCELAGLQGDSDALQQRLFAYHRPVTNLLQYRWAILERVPAMTADQMEAYFANQLLYAFHPGISTAGGGTQPGYAGMHRYVEDPDLLARDRPLFDRYLPVFDALAAAGWEPVTHARTDPQLLVERYGSGPEVYLAIHNPTQEAVTGALTLDAAWWRQAVPGAGELRFVSLLDRQPSDPARLTVPALRTVVLRAAR